MFIRLVLILLLTGASAPAGEPTIRLLTKDDAGAAIIEEKIEPYFKRMRAVEMAMKLREEPRGDTIDEKRDDCRRKYAQMVRDFTDDEKTALRAAIESVHPTLEKHYPLMAGTPWSIIKKSDVLEGGAHFTRESHIVLSEHVLARAAKLVAEGKKEAAAEGLLPLLLHEQMHVLQRLHAAKFRLFYESHWGYVHPDEIVMTDWIVRHSVVNPDGVDDGWIIALKDAATGEPTYHWPVVMLTKTEGAPVMFRDMRMLLIDIERKDAKWIAKVNADGSPVARPLAESKALAARFPHGNAYHPNEAAAAAMPEVILADMKPARDEKKPEDRKAAEVKLREWMRKELK